MAPDLLEGAVRALEEVLVGEAVVVAGWEATGPGLVPVGIVSAPIAEPECPIR